VNVLALDLGTQTGWAISANGHITSGTERFANDRHSGGGMRYLKFKWWLSKAHSLSGEFNAVFYEEVRAHAGTDAAHTYGGFLATLQAWCEHHNLPYEGVPVGTIKKHITGKGNANKQAVIKAVQQKLDPNITDDNEADARALLDLVAEPQGNAWKSD